MAIYLVTTVDGDVRRFDVADLAVEQGGVLVLDLTDSGRVLLSPSFWHEARPEQAPLPTRGTS